MFCFYGKHDLLDVVNLFHFGYAEVFCEEIAEVYRNDEWRLGANQNMPITRVPQDVFDQVVEQVSDLENMPDLAER